MLYVLAILSIIATIISVIGWQVITVAQINNVKSGTDYYISLNTLGIFLLFCAGGIDVASILFGPQALKGALGALPILLNIPIIYLFQCGCIGRIKKLQFTRYDIIFLFLIATSTVLSTVSFFISDTFDDYDTDPETIHGLLLLPTAVIYQIVFPVISILLSFIVFRFPTLGQVIATNAWIAGMFASLVVLYGKSALHLLNSDFETSTAIYIIGALYALCGQALLMYNSVQLHTSLSQTQEHITLYTISYTIWNMVAGGIVFQEFTDFTMDQWILFGVGTGLTLLLLTGWVVYIHKR